MARRDVDLVIKAKDQAASVVDNITKALNQFVQAQKNLDTRADKTQSTLTQLGGAIGKLDAALKGLTAGDKLASELGKSTKALDRLEAEFKQTSTAVSVLEKQLKQSKATLESYTEKLERNLAVQERQKAVIAKAKVDQKELTRAYEQAVTAQTKLQKKQQQLPVLIEKAATAAKKAATNFNNLSAQVAGTERPTAALVQRLATAERKMAETGARVTKLRTEFGNIGSNLNAAGSAMILFGGQAAKAGQNLSRQERILANMSQNYERIKASTAAVSQRQSRLSSDLNRSTGAMNRLEVEVEQARAGLDRLSASSAKATGELQDLTKRGFLALVAASRDQKRVMLETSQAYDQARAKATALGKALAQTTKPTRDMVQEFTKAASESTRLKTQLQDQRLALQAMSQTLQRSERSYEGLRGAQARFLEIIDRQVAAMRRAEAETTRQSASVRALASASTSAAGGANKLAGASSRLASANASAAASTSRLATAYRQFYGDTRRSLSLLQRIRGEVLSLVAAYGGLYGAIRALSETVDATQQLEAAQARLNVAFDNDTTRVAAEFDFVRRTSDRLGISLGVLATEYSKFNIATKNTSIEGAAARKIFLQVAEAARVNRSSTKDLSGVFVALTQIVSKGAVQMEELRQQLGDRLPGAIKIMADGLGVGTAELIKMMEQGEITEEALIGFGDELEKRFGGGLSEALKGVTVALGRLQNAAFQAAAEFGEGGFIAALTRFANTLTEVLKSADFEAFSRRISKALGGIVNALGFLAENFQVTFTLLATLLAVKLTPIVIALTGTMGRLAASARLNTVGFTALQTRAAAMGVTITRTGLAVRNLTRFLRGLVGSTGIGLAFIAISAAIAAWSTEADRATKALNTHKNIVDEVRNAYEAAGGEAENWADVIEGVTKQQARVSLDDITREFARARKRAVSDLTAIGDAYNPIIGGTEKTQRELQNLRKKFIEGSIMVAAYTKALEAVGEADPTLDLDFLVSLQDRAGEVKDIETAFDELTLVMDALGDSAEDAQTAMDALNGAADPENVNALADATQKLDKAMTALEDALPKVKTDTDSVAEAATDMATAYEDALSAARSLPEAIQRIAAEQGVLNDYAQKFGDLMKRSLDFAQSEFGNFSSGREASAALLRQVEGFREVPYFDVNAFRAGFGSDTVTLSDGTIQKVTEGMRVSLDDANRDLFRRIDTEFIPAVVGVTGQNRFNQFTPQQQAALVSIAYNYGSIPDRIAEAVRNGSNEQIQAAILSLRGDNGGVNSNRRFQEASLFGAVTSGNIDDSNERLENEREQAELTKERIADNAFEISQQQQILDGKARQAAIEKAIREARDDNPGITDEEIAKIKEQTGALFDLELAQKRAKDADKDASAAARDASQKVNALLAQRVALYKQLEEAEKNGDTTKQADLRDRIAEVNTQLTTAIENARAMWEAIGGPDAENALIKLDTAALSADTLGKHAQKVYLDWSRVADLFVTGLASAFDTFAKKVADGENVFAAARDAFLQFAADFLLQIAQMIIQQAIFNALQSAFGGTSFGSLIGLGHTGGMVGSSRVGSGNSSRRINPAVFAGAMRYHSGGVVGLRPGEVPIIAKEGEEMLTRNDPRHMMNGGGASSGGTPAVNVRNINTFDAASFLEAALDSPVGEKVLFNFVSANPGKFKAAMGS